ncbi:MAG: hypothetical protein AAGU23_00965 [Bacillota bacterium]
MMDFLARKVTAPGLVHLLFIAILATFSALWPEDFSWAKTLLLLFLWFAGIAGSVWGSLSIQDTSNYFLMTGSSVFLFTCNIPGSHPWRDSWFAALFAGVYILMSLCVMYKKSVANPYALLLLMIVFSIAGSVATDTIRMQPIDLWFLIRIGLWGVGTILFLCTCVNSGNDSTC